MTINKGLKGYQPRRAESYKEVIRLLQETKETQKYISAITNVPIGTVSKLNLGRIRVEETIGEIDYPIRSIEKKYRAIRKDYEEIKDTDNNPLRTLANKYKLRKYTIYQIVKEYDVIEEK